MRSAPYLEHESVVALEWKQKSQFRLDFPLDAGNGRWYRKLVPAADDIPLLRPRRVASCGTNRLLPRNCMRNGKLHHAQEFPPNSPVERLLFQHRRMQLR
jgi:hypothetical protein